MESLNLLAVVAVFVLAFAVMVGGIILLVRVFSRRGEGGGEDGMKAGEESEIEILNRSLTLAETARTEAEMASRAKSDFLAVMSHELRTPLNAIMGYAEIIETAAFDSAGGPAQKGRHKDCARSIREGGEHMLSLLNTILDLSKVEAGGMELNEETFDLLRVAHGVVDLFQARADARRVTLKVSLPDSLPLLFADERLVRQMLINLLSNAIENTYSDGWVVITAERDGRGSLTVVVADTGVGIAEDDLALALTPFRTLGDPRSRTSHGIGLGLPLVKSLIELHGGDFLINSKKDAGTTVAMTFPAERVGGGALQRVNGTETQA